MIYRHFIYFIYLFIAQLFIPVNLFGLKKFISVAEELRQRDATTIGHKKEDNNREQRSEVNRVRVIDVQRETRKR